MKILVLGSEGQIGKPFCTLAEANGHTIIRVDKKLNSWHDLSKNDCVLNTDTKLDFDICVFLAFEVGGSKYLEAKDKTVKYITENIDLMSNSFKFLNTIGKPFLFASSQMASMHHTNYGFLKDLGERLTKSSGGYICRFWNVYGYEDPKDPKAHVITDFIDMAKSGSINMITDGSEERQFLHTDDCSKALLTWCTQYPYIDKNEYIDITSYEWTSILDIAKIISSKIPCQVIPGSKKDSIQLGIKNTPSTYFTKFWKPEVSISEGIKKLIT